MKKILIILFTIATLPLYAQKVARVNGCKASIIYKSEDNFKNPYLQYYSAILMPGLESKTMKANPMQYEQIDNNQLQIVLPKNFKFGKTEIKDFEKRLASLEKYLTTHQNKPIQIDVVSGMLWEIKPVEAILKK